MGPERIRGMGARQTVVECVYATLRCWPGDMLGSTWMRLQGWKVWHLISARHPAVGRQRASQTQSIRPMLSAHPSLTPGRRLAFTRVNFFVNGKRAGFGSHTQAVSNHVWTHKFSEDGSKLIPVEKASL